MDETQDESELPNHCIVCDCEIPQDETTCDDWDCVNREEEV